MYIAIIFTVNEDFQKLFQSPYAIPICSSLLTVTSHCNNCFSTTTICIIDNFCVLLCITIALLCIKYCM